MAKRATTTFFSDTKRTIKRGESFRDDDPLVEQFPHFFEDIDQPEQATAGPGERRTLSPKSKAAKDRAAQEAGK